MLAYYYVKIPIFLHHFDQIISEGIITPFSFHDKVCIRSKFAYLFITL